MPPSSLPIPPAQIARAANALGPSPRLVFSLDEPAVPPPMPATVRPPAPAPPPLTPPARPVHSSARSPARSHPRTRSLPGDPPGRRSAYTSGEVARILGVSARLAVRWIDAGSPAGYRLPGSGDRRVSHRAMAEFLRKHPEFEVDESEPLKGR